MQEKIANKITSNPEVFENSFLMRFPTEKELSKAKDLLGFDIPNEYVWFLKTYGHGGFFFEFLGYGKMAMRYWLKRLCMKENSDCQQNCLLLRIVMNM